MSSDKRALDDLDAMFREVPDKAVSTLRPSKKLRHAQAKPKPSPADEDKSKKDQHITRRNISTDAGERKIPRGLLGALVPYKLNNSSWLTSTAGSIADEFQPFYRFLPQALLPQAQRQATLTPRRGNRGTKAVGPVSAAQLTEFVRGVLGARGQRAVDLAIESRLHRKVVYLENVDASGEAQSSAARAARAARRVQQGLSGKQCKKKGLNEVKSMDGGKVSFRDLLGVHDLWKAYASRLVSQCKSNRKLVQQRILSADLQGCFLTVSKASASSLVNAAGIVVRETSNTIEVVTVDGKTKAFPKRGCVFRLAFGELVVELVGGALAGRGRRSRPESREQTGLTSIATATTVENKPELLPTTAL